MVGGEGTTGMNATAGDCWLPFGIPMDQSITADMVFGPQAGPNRCPVCSQPDSSWDMDQRGFLFQHSGRQYPCRLVVGGQS